MAKKTFISSIKEMDGKVYNHHIPVPKNIVEYFKSQVIKRFHIQINKQLRLRGGILYNEEGPYLLFNQKYFKDLPDLDFKKIQVEIWPDESKYGLEMPQILEEALAQDLIAHSHFENLSPGKQRNLIHLVEKVKSEDLKLRNAILICRHLSESNGKLDFKVLRESFKDYRM